MSKHNNYTIINNDLYDFICGVLQSVRNYDTRTTAFILVNTAIMPLLNLERKQFCYFPAYISMTFLRDFYPEEPQISLLVCAQTLHVNMAFIYK